MPARRTRQTTRRDAGPRPARVLVVDADAKVRDRIRRVVGGDACSCDGAPSCAAAREALSGFEYDLVVIGEGMRDGDALALTAEIGGSGGARAMVLSSRPTVQGAIDSLRAGALDLVSRKAEDEELSVRVGAALARAIRERERDEEMERLRRACKRLRKRDREQRDETPDGEVAPMSSLAQEFSKVVRQELDVESLLRSCLEFVLARSGPTNGAIFLPSNHCDFNVGAYVNYDCDRDSMDLLLDQLSDTVPARFEREESVVLMRSRAQLEKRMGDDSRWLTGREVVIATCIQDGECLAVLILFRDRDAPFAEDLRAQLRVVCDVFGDQLARVIRIHHRHRPDEAWPGFEAEGEEDDGWGDMAA